MKQLLIILFFLSITASAYSNHSGIDSLLQALPESKGNSTVDILNTLGWELKYENTNEAFKYAREALQLAEKNMYKKGKSAAIRNLAALNLLTNNGKEAIRYANEGILFATAIRDTFTLAKLYNIKGLVLEDQYSYSLAIEFFNKSYDLFEEIGNEEEMTGILNNIAVVYGAINERKQELETYIKVIEQEESRGNKFGLARTYNNIAGVYEKLGDSRKALDFYRKSVIYSRETGAARFESAALNGIAIILQEQSKPDSAIFYYNKAIEINRKNNYQQWLANNFLNLGGLYLEILQDPDMGNHYLDEAGNLYESISDWNNYVMIHTIKAQHYLNEHNLAMAKSMLAGIDLFIDSIGSENLMKEVYNLKYVYSKATGNYKEALKYLELVNSINDSIQSKQQIQHSYEIQAKYDLSRQEQANEKLRMSSDLNMLTIRKQKIVIFASIVICLLLAFIIFLSLRSKQRIKKANLALNDISDQILDKAMELQQANESKDKFLSIISHDLKNPINAITGLSDLLLDDSMEIPEDEKKKFIKYINEGCHSTDHLLENLMKWVRSQTGKMEMNAISFDLADPVKNAVSVVNNAAFRKNINIQTHIPEGTMVYGDQEMISTCLLNLMSNAVKFTNVNGNVVVTAESNGHYVHLHVKDDGVGINEEQKAKLFRLDTKSGTPGTANEKGTGLGLLLVKEFIEKNRGEININSEAGNGSTFILSIPKFS
jgi:signal transduction histidine kinase